MISPTVLLIVDANPNDLQALQQSLTGTVNEIITAATPHEALVISSKLDAVSVMIGAIPDTDGDSLFEMRDELQKLFGAFPSVFCSATDMSAYYPQVSPGDKLFYKPVEIPTLKEWLTASVGPPTPQAVPAAQTEGPDRAETTSQDVTDYDEDLPVGIQLGDYKLERAIQRDKDFAMYEAEQTSINRKVAIKTLYRKHRRDPVWVQAFVNEASARAKVSHPDVSLVYECIQEQGVNFYTLELVDAPSLEDLAKENQKLSDNTLWGIMETCTSVLEYFHSHNMHHRLLTSQAVMLQHGEQTRIANSVKAVEEPLNPEEQQEQMQLLASIFKPFIRKGVTDANLYSIVDRLGHPQKANGIKTIADLRASLKDDVEAKASSASKHQDNYQEALKKQKNKNAVVVGGLIGLILVAGGIFSTQIFFRPKPEVKEFNEFIPIKSGPFPYQNGALVEVPDFWMGAHEVTIGQYAGFLDDIANKPTTLQSLQHPDQPADKTSHLPLKWDLMHTAAMEGRKFQGATITPNFPIMGVDWWDAYAYARWKNARLPTEIEWEKAARSRAGNKYPWGNELDLSKFNSGHDQNDNGEQKAGSVDGFQFWCAVDSDTLSSTDMSRYGVSGLAGNVSEWTASWAAHPDNPELKVPIKRGGSFGTSEKFEMTWPRPAETPNEKNYFTGFRIVSDIKPGSDASYRPPVGKRIEIAGLTPQLGTNAQPDKIASKAPTQVSESSATSEPEAMDKPASTAAVYEWDSADGTDPFSTIFAIRP